MKKKFLCLLMAMVMSLSLTVTALADGHELYVYYPNGEWDAVVGPDSGEDWSFDDVTNTLTLSGVNAEKIIVNDLDQGWPTIVLAPGSKNTINALETESLMDGDGYTVTFKGSGELIIYDANANANGVFSGCGNNVKLEDGLTMTGGTKTGDSGALTFKAFNDYPNYKCMAGSTPAKYIRIGGEPSLTGFTDVANSSPYAEAIKWAVDQKITAGKTATTFGPNDTCTLAHIITFLWRANGKPAPKAETGSDDISRALSWAADVELVSQTDDPNGACTRSRAVYCMWLAAGKPESSKAASFSDVSADVYYAPAVNWAVEKGITSGTSATTFSPDNTCTRGQIVTFLYRAGK